MFTAQYDKVSIEAMCSTCSTFTCLSEDWLPTHAWLTEYCRFLWSVSRHLLRSPLSHFVILSSLARMHNILSIYYTGIPSNEFHLPFFIYLCYTCVCDWVSDPLLWSTISFESCFYYARKWNIFSPGSLNDQFHYSRLTRMEIANCMKGSIFWTFYSVAL